jgi:hypothetical protein
MLKFNVFAYRMTTIERSPVLALIETQTDLKVKFIDF